MFNVYTYIRTAPLDTRHSSIIPKSNQQRVLSVSRELSAVRCGAPVARAPPRSPVRPRRRDHMAMRGTMVCHATDIGYFACSHATIVQ